MTPLTGVPGKRVAAYRWSSCVHPRCGSFLLMLKIIDKPRSRWMPKDLLEWFFVALTALGLALLLLVIVWMMLAS